MASKQSDQNRQISRYVLISSKHINNNKYQQRQYVVKVDNDDSSEYTTCIDENKDAIP